MQLKKPDKGLIVSSAAHAGLLVLALVGFWQAPKFDDAAESVPVDMITEQQFQQITKGEKPGKAPQPAIKAVKPAEIADIKPDVPVNPVVKDTPPPPPMRPRIDPPEEASEPPPPVKVVTPQPKPEPPAPPPVVRPVEPTPKPVPPPPVVRAPDPPKAAPPPPPDAEVITPKPVPRPDPVKQVAAVPDPPKPPPKPVAPKQPDPPSVPEKPKAVEKPAKPVLDQVASLLDASKPDPAAKPNPDATTKLKHTRPAAPANPLASTKPFDPSAINSILQANASTSKPSASPAPAPASSAGLPTAKAPQMSVRMGDEFDQLLKSHFDGCWNKDGIQRDSTFKPNVLVQFRQNGTFATEPVLSNRSSDPAARIVAESALRAIRTCPPLVIPPRFLQFFAEWKETTLIMNPAD